MAQTETAGSTLVGYFEDRSKAEDAVEALKDAGFSSAHLGVASRNTTGSSASTGTTTNAGAKTEGMWDKVKGFFEGGDAEPYATEKRDGDLATREITSDPSYGSDDLHGTLSGMAVPEDRSKYFNHRFDSSEDGVLVTVSAAGREADAETILRRFGADLGDSHSEYDYAAAPAKTARTDGAQNIQLLGEALRVHKDRISRGEVTLRKEVTTEMQTIQVPVTREELVIERHAATDGTAPTGGFGDTGAIRIPLSEEQASIEKSTFVREEISVGKRNVEDVKQMSGEVRSEELVVDDQTKNIPQNQK